MIKFEQMIHKETPIITEKLYKNMNLFQRKNKTTIQFKDSLFFITKGSSIKCQSLKKDLQTMEFFKINQGTKFTKLCLRKA